jgi:alkyl sulfatase BDS1-like metallo-beta-lactamase superfamily hydrolase
LPRDPHGHVDQAIGKNVANGSMGLFAPNLIITKDFEELTLDGVKMVFQNTPDTDAPVEMNTWFPQVKAFWAADNVTSTIHNTYTLRGAPVRNALNWSKEINAALWKFGQEADVMFASHSWPRWGNDRIQEVLRAQRDTYANLNNQALHYANLGVTINEIHNVYAVPKSLQQQWAARSYHGDAQNNSRAVINRFLGFYDGNPVNLHPLSPQDSAPLYVEMMAGSAKIMAKGKELIAKGQYLQATEILNKLVFAEPRNQPARGLLADAYEQLSYQAESTSVRNSFLQSEMSVSDLVLVARVSQPAVSQHLRVLREAGLVDERRGGRFRYYRLKAEPLAGVMSWVRTYEQFWTDKLAALGRVPGVQQGLCVTRGTQLLQLNQ